MGLSMGDGHFAIDFEVAFSFAAPFEPVEATDVATPNPW